MELRFFLFYFFFFFLIFSSSQAHGWLSGGHPAPGEGEVDRTVFFDDGSNDKRNPTSIKVVNCNDEYFVYYLPDVCGCVGGGCVSDRYSGYCTQ